MSADAIRSLLAGAVAGRSPTLFYIEIVPDGANRHVILRRQRGDVTSSLDLKDLVPFAFVSATTAERVSMLIQKANSLLETAKIILERADLPDVAAEFRLKRLLDKDGTPISIADMMELPWLNEDHFEDWDEDGRWLTQFQTPDAAQQAMIRAKQDNPPELRYIVLALMEKPRELDRTLVEEHELTDFDEESQHCVHRPIPQSLADEVAAAADNNTVLPVGSKPDDGESIQAIGSKQSKIGRIHKDYGG